MVNSILVVCVGNICRSPMAEALLKHQYPHLVVASAGLSALIGHTADDNAVAVMDSLSLDIRAHRAQQLNAALMQAHDLIFCMSYRQERWLKQQWPYQRGKIYRLGTWLARDIADPYGKSRDDFIHCRDLIRQSLDTWQDRIA